MTDWVRIAAVRAGTQTSVLQGRFVERPHRFAARVELPGGEVVEAHVPNPGRLTGVLAPGCRVAVEGPLPPPRTLRYTMLGARVRRTWIGTVTTYANRVFPALLAAGLFPELGAVETRREVVHGRSRFDFEILGRFVEVKSVSLARGSAGLFPDAVTARGARHCDELAALARRRRPAAIVFVAQRGDVASVAPEDDIDPAFGQSLRAAARAGVLVLACALDMTPAAARAARRLPVIL